MYNKILVNSIDLTAIDISDRRYYLSPIEQTSPEESLIESIRQFGILHPPILTKKNNKIIIVTGWKRIHAARQISPASPIAGFLLPEKTEQSNIYELIIEEAVNGRPFSPAEQAMLLKKYIQHYSKEAALPLLGKLGYKRNLNVIDELLSLLNLSPNTIKGVHNSKIPFKSACKMKKLSTDDQETVTGIITTLNMGGSKQNKLIEYCIELSMRTQLSLEKIFKDFFEEVHSRQEENIPQQTSALLHWLQQKCFPRITQAEESFRENVTRLRLPDNFSLNHSLSFEDDQLKLSILFPDMQTMNQVLPELVKIAGKKSQKRKM